MISLDNNFLNDDEIVAAIKEYIDDKIYNYAVLIDGDWGCGKTYFVKNVLKKEIDNSEEVKKTDKYIPKKVVYISLYGIQTTKDISNELYINILDGKDGRRKDFVKSGIKILSDVLKTKGIDIDNGNAIIGKFIDMSNYILIFDDLERCGCDITEVLGYINNFVEHDGVKVILIANQDEIGKYNTYQNVELKYMIAQSREIEFDDAGKATEDKSNEFCGNDNNGKTEYPVSIQEIKRRTQELFGQNDIYERVKEKLIGVTIKYNPDLIQVTKELIKTNIDDLKLRNIILELQEDNIEFSLRRGHPNLRTYQFFLSKIKELNKIISSIDHENQKEIITFIAEYCFDICVLYKIGEYKNIWVENSLYGNIPLDGQYAFSGYVLGFKFVDEFIVHSKLNKDEVIIALNDYFNTREDGAGNSDDPLNTDQAWWESSEQEVQKNIEEIIDGVRQNKYPISLYPKIILRVVSIPGIALSKDYIPEMTDLMIKNIEISSTPIKLNESAIFIQEAEASKKYNDVLATLKQKANEKNNNDSIGKLNDIIEDVNMWGANLHDYVIEHKDDSLEKRSFISKVNVNKIILNIEKGDNKNISMFRYAILKTYNFSNIKDYFAKDVDNLKKMITGINAIKTSEFDSIKKFNINALLELLAEKHVALGGIEEDLI